MTPEERVAILRRLVDERLAHLRARIERLERTIEALNALRAIPFDGECVT